MQFNKEFLKKWAINTLIIWVVQFAIILLLNIGIHDYFFRGLPFKYLEGGGICPPDGSCGNDFYPIRLLLDLIIWIIFGLGLTYLRNKKK